MLNNRFIKKSFLIILSAFIVLLTSCQNVKNTSDDLSNEENVSMPSTSKENDVESKVDKLDNTLYHIVVLGQSLSMGFATESSLKQPETSRAFMFKHVRTQDFGYEFGATREQYAANSKLYDKMMYEKLNFLKESGGVNLWNLYLWNENNQTQKYTLYADLTKYTNDPMFNFYNFGVCIASISVYNPLTFDYEDYDLNLQMVDYNTDKCIWNFAAAYYRDSNFCSDTVSKNKGSLVALKGRAKVIFGTDEEQKNYLTYQYKFYAAEDNPANIWFIPYVDQTVQFNWNNG